MLHKIQKTMLLSTFIYLLSKEEKKQYNIDLFDHYVLWCLEIRKLFDTMKRYHFFKTVSLGNQLSTGQELDRKRPFLWLSLGFGRTCKVFEQLRGTSLYLFWHLIDQTIFPWIEKKNVTFIYDDFFFMLCGRQPQDDSVISPVVVETQSARFPLICTFPLSTNGQRWLSSPALDWNINRGRFLDWLEEAGRLDGQFSVCVRTAARDGM